VVVIIRASGVRWSMPSRRLRRGRRREACPEDPFPRRLSCTHVAECYSDQPCCFSIMWVCPVNVLSHARTDAQKLNVDTEPFMKKGCTLCKVGLLNKVYMNKDV